MIDIDNLIPNFGKLEEYNPHPWYKELPGGDELMNLTKSSFKIQATLHELLKKYNGLNNYANELMAFAVYYKTQWIFFNIYLLKHNNDKRAKAFGDFEKLFNFLKNNKLDKILFSANDKRNAVKNHVINNPFVIQEVKSLLEYFYEIYWPRKQAEYIQFEKTYALLQVTFPKKKNVRPVFNRSLTFLAKFLRNETYLKTGTKAG